MSDRTALYRHWDSSGRLLYVGISNHFPRRLDQHVSGSRWRDLISSATVEYFDTREEALIAERAAIRCERPIYNIAHNDNSANLALSRRGTVRIIADKAATTTPEEAVSATKAELEVEHASDKTIVLVGALPKPPDGDRYVTGMDAHIFYGTRFHEDNPPPKYHRVLANGRRGPRVWLESELEEIVRAQGREPYEEFDAARESFEQGMCSA